MVAELRSRLTAELDHLVETLTVHIPERLGTDQPHDDYQDTLAMQRLVRDRVQALRRLIDGLEGLRPEMVPADRAGFGSLVRVLDERSGEELAFTLLASDALDAEAGEVSLASPVGRALLGRAAGEVVEVATPQRPRRLRVLAVTTIHQRLGGAEVPPPQAG